MCDLGLAVLVVILNGWNMDGDAKVELMTFDGEECDKQGKNVSGKGGGSPDSTVYCRGRDTSHYRP